MATTFTVEGMETIETEGFFKTGDLRVTIEEDGKKYLQWFRNVNDIN